MSYQLTGIAQYCEKASGGLVRVEYLPVNWLTESSFESSILKDWNLQKAPGIATGDWLELYLIPDQRLWQEEYNPDEQGGYYEQTVTGFLPVHTAALAEELDTMRRYPFILRLTDRLGEKFILGSPNEALTFTSRATTGNSAANTRGHTITFTGKTIKKAFTFNPEF